MIEYDYEVEWFLKPFEVKQIKSGKKTIIRVPTEVRFNTILFANGLAMKVERVFDKTFNKLSDSEYRSYGVKHGVIEASCEHPDLHCLYYGTEMCSGNTNNRSAIEYYIQKHEPNLKMTKKYKFVEITMIFNLS